MTINSEEPKVAEETPARKSKLSLVVVLSMLLGILLTLGGGGAVLHLRESRALQAEMLVIRAELKKKNLALEDMQSQIGALSSQMSILKDNAVARSRSTSEKNKEGAAPAADANESKSAGGKEKTVAPDVPVPPKAAKLKPAVQNCELVGKSPEDQAATLKRCVSLIDQPASREKARLR